MPPLKLALTRARGNHRPSCAANYRPTGAVRYALGVSLIEVVIAMVVLLIGLLGMLKLQSETLKLTYSSFQQTLASVQTQDLIERMWAGICILRRTDPLLTSEEYTYIVDEWKSRHDPTQPFKSALSSTQTLRMDAWEASVVNRFPDTLELTIEWNDPFTSTANSVTTYFSMPDFQKPPGNTWTNILCP